MVAVLPLVGILISLMLTGTPHCRGVSDFSLKVMGLTELHLSLFSMIPTNGRTAEHDPAKTGIPTTKWSPHAQWALILNLNNLRIDLLGARSIFLKSQTNRFYRPELDILRFFAFFCVFLFHTANKQASNSRLGEITSAAEFSLSFAVSLFFMLSAFLITSLLEIELDQTGRVHVGAFYARRATRIWPLYYFFLLIWVAVGFLAPAWKMDGGYLAGWLLMVGNWYIILHASQFGFSAIIWSVNIEEQFYLFCPWVVTYFRRKGLIVMSVAGVVVSFATLFWMGHRQVFDDTSLRLNTFVEILYFSVGALIACLLRRRTFEMPLAGRLLSGIAGLSCWTAGTYFFDSRSQHPILSWWTPAAEYGLVCVGCIALFFGFYGLSVGKAGRPFVYLGKISYGLYLYHILFIAGIRSLSPNSGGPALKLGRFALALGLSVATAAASYAWFEKPILRLKERFTFVPSRSV
jgi:peptidoglycan/LPS O-acetylase OafA/YrhL